MRRYLFAAIAAAIAALLTALPAMAANNVLTINSAGGPAVNVNDVLHSGLKSGTVATFQNTTNSNKVTCNTSTFSATVVTNPAAPGTATETLNTQTFSNCSTNFGATVNSVTVDHLTYNASVASGGAATIAPGSSGPIQTTVKVTQVFSFTCVYQVNDASGKLFGTTSNADNSLAFSNQRFKKTSGASVCFSAADFSATYAPVKDQTQGDAPVFTN